MALAIWKQLKVRPRADRNIVYLALAGRLLIDVSQAKSAKGARMELYRRALRLCTEETGRVPSRRAYEAWRAALERPDEWPSPTAIRNAFGSWPKALQAAGLDAAPDPRGAALAVYRVHYDADALIAALRCWREREPDAPLTSAAYHRFVLASRAAGSESDVALPSTPDPFEATFGSWRRALIAAGLAEPRARPERWRGPARFYTDEHITACLQRAAVELDVDRLTSAAFHAWADATCRAAAAVGEQLHIPSTKFISDRFGSWRDALVAAGLADDAASPPTRTIT